MKKRLLTVLAVLTGIILILASIVWADPPAPVAKTGQTTCYDTAGSVISCAGTGQDGDLQKGIASPSPRFTDNGEDGTVTDNLTGLMWAKDANLDNGTMVWNDAIDYANNLSLGLYGCGLSYTDWRLPNVKELQSLLMYVIGNVNQALPNGHPFLMGMPGSYWTSTSCANSSNCAWVLNRYFGWRVENLNKNLDVYVWPVRSGN